MRDQSLFVLASLASGERHGYGIAQDTEELSEGRVRLTAGTLYGALNRLTDEGLVAESREEVVEGRRRRSSSSSAVPAKPVVGAMASTSEGGSQFM